MHISWLVPIGLLLAQPAFSQSRLCDNRQVVTNTVAGSAMTADIALANPEYAQLAALVADVDPDQQDLAKRLAWESLKRNNHNNWDVFTLLLMQAKSGQQMKRGLEGATKIGIGAVVGGFTGALAGEMTKGAIGGGIAGGLAARSAGTFVQIVTDETIVQPILDRLVRNPCEISASDALAQIEQR